MKAFALERKHETDSEFLGVYDSLEAAQLTALRNRIWNCFASENEDKIKLTWLEPFKDKECVVYETDSDYPVYQIIECEMGVPCSFGQDR